MDTRHQHSLTCMVSSRTTNTMHKFIVVLHQRIAWIVTGARVARMVGTINVSTACFVLRPDGVTCQTRQVIPFAAIGHLALDGLLPFFVSLLTNEAQMLPRFTLQTTELIDVTRAFYVLTRGMKISTTLSL